MVTQTTLEAFEAIKPNLGEKQKDVYYALMDLECANNRIIAKKLNWPINSVTPRVFELRQFGLIVLDSIREDPTTKRNTEFWRIR